MKFQAFFMLAMVVALSGFTWGSAEDQKTTTKKTSAQVKQEVKKQVASVNKTASTYSSSAYVPAPTTDNRASAVRVLTAGDEATRKARLDSLARIAKSLSASKAARESKTSQY